MELERRSLRDAYRQAVLRLRAQTVPTPELDARLLLCAAADISLEDYVMQPDRRLGPEAEARLAGYLAQREMGEPVSRIVGFREFFGRPFRIDASTLDPRPETETLVDAALAIADELGGRDRPLTILDLGTGSGCLLVTLLAELEQASGIGTDISEEALACARANAEQHGVADRAAFVRADWLDPIGGRFDLIVCNPPYIARGEIVQLAREVKDHDPVAALDGGEDGLDVYRKLSANLAGALKPGGAALLEIGAGQADPVRGLLSRSGLGRGGGVECRRDLAGRPRCIVVQGGGGELSQAKKSLENRGVRASFDAAE